MLSPGYCFLYRFLFLITGGAGLVEVDAEITAVELVADGSEQHKIRGGEMLLLFLLEIVKLNIDWDGNESRQDTENEGWTRNCCTSMALHDHEDVMLAYYSAQCSLFQCLRHFCKMMMYALFLPGLEYVTDGLETLGPYDDAEGLNLFKKSLLICKLKTRPNIY